MNEKITGVQNRIDGFYELFKSAKLIEYFNLTKGEYEVFLRIRYEGMETEAVATELDLPLNIVEQLYNSAVARINNNYLKVFEKLNQLEKVTCERDELLEENKYLKEVIDRYVPAGTDVKLKIDRVNYTSLRSLNLPLKIHNALWRNKLEFIGDLRKAGKTKLLTLPGLGKTSLQYLEAELAKLNVKLPR